MIRLDLDPQPYWLDIVPGVRFRLAPVGTAVITAARRDPAVMALPEDAPDEHAALAMARAIGAVAILEWEGIADAGGSPVPPTRENVAAVMDIYPIFEKFQLEYVAKGLVLESEKNASAPLPNGTSEGAPDTVPPARRSAKIAPAG